MHSKSPIVLMVGLSLFLPGRFDTKRRRIMAFACVRLTDRRGDRSGTYLKSLGETASWQSVEHDARTVLWYSDNKLLSGPGSDGSPRTARSDEDWVLRPWMLLRWEAIGVFRALLQVLGDPRRPVDLMSALAHVPGVCDLYELQQGGLIATIAYDSPTDLERIRLAVDELVGDRDIAVLPIRSESSRPTVATIEELTGRGSKAPE